MLSHKTLVMLLDYDPSLHPGTPLPCSQPQVTFAYAKHLWMTDQKSLAFDLLSKFFNEYTQQCNSGEVPHDESQRLLARCYLKLGAWKEALEGITENSIPSILNCYRQATEHDSSWYKAWHSWAYMNFETVLFYKQKQELASRNTNPPVKTNEYITYTVLAVEGFFKSIKLSKGSSLQDTLRLLTLWFEYGQWTEVYEALVEGIKLIEKNTWLQVIPQLIARIDTPRALVSRLIHFLLIDIGKIYPQVRILNEKERTIFLIGIFLF